MFRRKENLQRGKEYSGNECLLFISLNIKNSKTKYLYQARKLNYKL